MILITRIYSLLSDSICLSSIHWNGIVYVRYTRPLYNHMSFSVQVVADTACTLHTLFPYWHSEIMSPSKPLRTQRKGIALPCHSSGHIWRDISDCPASIYWCKTCRIHVSKYYIPRVLSPVVGISHSWNHTPLLLLLSSWIIFAFILSQDPFI